MDGDSFDAVRPHRTWRDGFIARKFDATSDVGKILDPIADKLTQGAMLFCLLTRFPLMWVPLALLIVKELFIGLTRAYGDSKDKAGVQRPVAREGGHLSAVRHDDFACDVAGHSETLVGCLGGSLCGDEADFGGAVWMPQHSDF